MDGAVKRSVEATVAQFWQTRGRQDRQQGARPSQRDAGQRATVTGGRQLDGFVDWIRSLICDAGLPDEHVFVEHRRTILPGFFRPTKEWDIVVVIKGKLLATVEFKSHVGPSFSNNFNNRTEEAVGSAHDLWTAYREGAFSGSPRPWLGYLMLLEDCPQSTRPVSVHEPHFAVLDDFRNASYARRYDLLCQRLVRERLYDAACLIMSDRDGGSRGQFVIPNQEIGIEHFAASLAAHIQSHLRYID